jgi:hypothetical protein
MFKLQYTRVPGVLVEADLHCRLDCLSARPRVVMVTDGEMGTCVGDLLNTILGTELFIQVSFHS